MSISIYYLTNSVGTFPIVWDGQTPFVVPDGSTISLEPPDTVAQAETLEQSTARVHAETDALYEALPITVQGMFLPVYAGVKDAISRGNYRQARAAVDAQAVPDFLKEAKAAILAAIPREE